MTPSRSDTCAGCGRPLKYGGWWKTGEAPPRHFDCKWARVRELQEAIDRIWADTGCFRDDRAVEVAASCHAMAEAVR